MMDLLESSAGRIAAKIQSMGSSFDPEVLSLPGGTLIAVVLWAYARTRMSLQRGPCRHCP